MGLLDYFMGVFFIPIINLSVISFQIMLVALIVIIPLSNLLKNKINNNNLLDDSKRAYWLFPVSVIVGIISSLPAAGKGYDGFYFTYIMRTIPERGLNIIWKTDRPFYYFITFCLRNLFNISNPKISVSLSGVLGVVLFICATYVLAKTLFDRETASYSALVTSSFFLLTQMSVNFIGNLYGLAFMYLYINSMINYHRYRKLFDIFVSTCMILIAVQFHLFSAYFIGGVVGLFLLYGRSYKPLLIGDLHGLLIRAVINHSSYASYSYITYTNLGMLTNINIPQIISDTFKGIDYGWTSEYFWIMGLSLAGLWFIVKEKGNLVTIWSIVITACMFYVGVFSGRILYYYPFGLTAGYFMRIMDAKKLKHFLILFLICVPLARYQFNDRWLMVRYFEDHQIYAWDTFQEEDAQILWLTRNYDVEDTVVVTDVPFLGLGGFLGETHPHLALGIDYRLLSEVGNNLYVGRLTDLINDDFKGYGSLETYPYWGYNGTEIRPYLGYEDNSTDKHLHTKTILIPDQIYNIGPDEMKYLEPLYTVPNTTQIIYTLKEEYQTD